MSPTQKTEPGQRTADANGAVLHESAAEALCAALPVSVPVSARRFGEPGGPGKPDASALTSAGNLAVAGFVGGVSADVALQLDPSILGDAADLDPTLVSLDDVLRPAFEAATGVLGSGVLSTAATGSAQTLLQDAQTAVFQLLAEDRAVGWFALRLREPAPGSGSALDPQSRSEHATTTQRAGGDVTSRLSRLNNVQMALTVEIGRTRVSVRDVLAMEPGAVIELDRNAGAPADVRLNGRLIAQGEVVVMDQDYGVRITQILDASEGLT